ncbi:hypothetical protein V1512DRAFT_264048 [Lipomyces arxii]|uniref:uncharacterized protein n=1 Tax=Lipomyces arxii TaxID=56418 RepID=UPI0034CEE752
MAAPCPMRIKLHLYSPKHSSRVFKVVYPLPEELLYIKIEELLRIVYFEFEEFLSNGSNDPLSERFVCYSEDECMFNMQDLVADVLHDGEAFCVYQRLFKYNFMLEETFHYAYSTRALLTRALTPDTPRLLLLKDSTTTQVKHTPTTEESETRTPPFQGKDATRKRNARRKRARVMRSTSIASNSGSDMAEIEQLRARLLAQAESLPVRDGFYNQPLNDELNNQDSLREEDTVKEADIAEEADKVENADKVKEAEKVEEAQESKAEKERIVIEVQDDETPANSQIQNRFTFMDKIGSQLQNALATFKLGSPGRYALPPQSTVSSGSTTSLSSSQQPPDCNDAIAQEPTLRISEIIESEPTEPELLEAEPVESIPPKRAKTKMLIAEAVDCEDHTNDTLKIPPYPFKQVNVGKFRLPQENDYYATPAQQESKKMSFDSWRKEINGTEETFEIAEGRNRKRRRRTAKRK